jgi:hypothetical protein
LLHYSLYELNVYVFIIKDGYFSFGATSKQLIFIFAALAKRGEVDEWLKSAVC